MRYLFRPLITTLVLFALLCCLSHAVQAQQFRYECDPLTQTCRAVPVQGYSQQSSVTSSTTVYGGYGGYSQPTYYTSPPTVIYSTPTYYSPPVYHQQQYATPPRQSFVQTYRGPFGGTWTRAYSATGAGVVSSGFYGGSSCGNPYCGCVNCRCVNCVCGY